MNKLRLLVLMLFVSVFASVMFGQAVPTQTTLSYAITTTAQVTIFPASNTGFLVGNYVFVDCEAMQITGVSTLNTSVTVRRAQLGTPATLHAAGAMVLQGLPQIFQAYDPQGSCTASSTLAQPLINVRTGYQWLCSSVSNTWVPGFNNSFPVSPTTAVASAAGLVTPTGPLFHITGTNAITGFNIPVGFAKGTICAVPDAIWTTTTANNIALASTAVVSKVECWTYDPNTAKFYPSY